MTSRGRSGAISGTTIDAGVWIVPASFRRRPGAIVPGYDLMIAVVEERYATLAAYGRYDKWNRCAAIVALRQPKSLVVIPQSVMSRDFGYVMLHNED